MTATEQTIEAVQACIDWCIDHPSEFVGDGYARTLDALNSLEHIVRGTETG